MCECFFLMSQRFIVLPSTWIAVPLFLSHCISDLGDVCNPPPHSLLTRTISFAPQLFKINHCSTCERGQLWSAAAAWMNSSSKVRPHIPTETKHGLTHVVQMRHLEHFGYSSLSAVISLRISLVKHRRRPRLKRPRPPLLAFSPRGDARAATAIQLCSTYSHQSDSGAG